MIFLSLEIHTHLNILYFKLIYKKRCLELSANLLPALSPKTNKFFFFTINFININNINLIRSFNTCYKSFLLIKERELALESFLGNEIVIKKALSTFLKIKFLYFLIFS